MRKLTLVFLFTFSFVGAFVSLVDAQSPTLWTPDAKKFDHVGQMIYYPTQKQDHLADRDDVYYSGDYACLPGDEHHAPVCKLSSDWYIYVQIAKTVFILDDGKKLEEGEPCLDFQDNFCVLAQNWKEARRAEGKGEITIVPLGPAVPDGKSMLQYGDPSVGTFLYRVITNKRHPGEYGIVVDYVGKQKEHYFRASMDALRAAPIGPTFK
jgi:hypothetical protein